MNGPTSIDQTGNAQPGDRGLAAGDLPRYLRPATEAGLPQATAARPRSGPVFGRLQVAGWSALGLVAAGYLALLVGSPDTISDLALRSPEASSEPGLARNLSKIASEVAVLQRSVLKIETDVSRVKSQVAEQDGRERALVERVQMVESRVDKFAPAQALAQAPSLAIAAPKPLPPVKPVVKNVAATDVAKTEPPRPLETGSIRAPAAPSAVEALADGRAAAIQLAAGPSVDALRLSWSLLNDRHGATLKSLEPRVVKGENGAYQLVAGPFPNEGQAVKTCTQLRAKGVGCRPAEFKGDSL
jgi:hypothetical protein